MGDDFERTQAIERWQSQLAASTRSTRRAWLGAWSATPAAIAMGAIDLVHPDPFVAALTALLVAVAGGSWGWFAWRRWGPGSAKRRARAWLVAAQQRDRAFQAAVEVYVLTRASGTFGVDEEVHLLEAAKSFGLALPDLTEAFRTQRLPDGHPAAQRVEQIEALEKRIQHLTTVAAATTARIVQGGMLDSLEAQRRHQREQFDLERRTQELELQTATARARLASLQREIAQRVDEETGTLRYPHEMQVPVSTLGVSSESMQRAVDEGMRTVRDRAAIMEPALLGASITERARWSVAAPYGAGMTRELMALFDPSGDDDAKKP